MGFSASALVMPVFIVAGLVFVFAGEAFEFFSNFMVFPVVVFSNIRRR